MKSVLVTGGAGFIGSHFIRRILQFRQHNIQIVNLDLLTYAGNSDTSGVWNTSPAIICPR